MSLRYFIKLDLFATVKAIDFRLTLFSIVKSFYYYGPEKIFATFGIAFVHGPTELFLEASKLWKIPRQT